MALAQLEDMVRDESTCRGNGTILRDWPVDERRHLNCGTPPDRDTSSLVRRVNVHEAGASPFRVRLAHQ
jgi:hypothetical protein